VKVWRVMRYSMIAQNMTEEYPVTVVGKKNHARDYYTVKYALPLIRVTVTLAI
jgi:hypothetical protein